MNTYLKTHSIKRVSLLTAIAIVLSIIESSMPIITSIPGGKLGLANIIIIVVMYRFSCSAAFYVNVIRALIVCLLYSGANSIPFSVLAAIISSLVIIASYKIFKERISPVGISVLGAFFHNLTQVCVSAVMLKSAAIFSYFTALIPIGLVSGIITGICAKSFLDFTKLGDVNE